MSGGALPAQAGPTPKGLCEAAPDGEAIDEDGNPRGDYASGDVPNIQKSGTSGRVNEGQIVLTNGMNVGHRAGTPSAPGALAAGAFTLDVTAGQGLRFQIDQRRDHAILPAATHRLLRRVKVPLIRVGGQGGVLNEARVEGSPVPLPAGDFDFKYTEGEILLDPGDRADVVAVIPAGALAGQVLTLWTQDFSRTGPSADVREHSHRAGRALQRHGTPGLRIHWRPATTLRASIPGAEVETLGAATRHPARSVDVLAGQAWFVEPGNPTDQRPAARSASTASSARTTSQAITPRFHTKRRRVMPPRSATRWN